VIGIVIAQHSQKVLFMLGTLACGRFKVVKSIEGQALLVLDLQSVRRILKYGNSRHDLNGGAHSPPLMTPKHTL
jgi:hypothetical protein